jgi:hypothetical protein
MGLLMRAIVLLAAPAWRRPLRAPRCRAGASRTVPFAEAVVRAALQGSGAAGEFQIVA